MNPLRPGRFCPWVFPAGLQRCRLLRRPATLRLRGVAVAERSPRWLPLRERPPVHFVVVAASVATSRLALASTIAGADGFGKLPPAKNSLPPTASHECTLGTRKESSQGQLHLDSACCRGGALPAAWWALSPAAAPESRDTPARARSAVSAFPPRAASRCSSSLLLVTCAQVAGSRRM